MMVNKCTEIVASLCLLCICISNAAQNTQISQSYNGVQAAHKTDLSEQQRSKRFFFKKRQPGLIITVGQSIYQQLNDTTSAARQISNIIRSSFATPNQTTSAAVEVNGTTTEAPYSISSDQFIAILRRNLRGLVRLFRIEVKDALNQTKYSISDYKQEFGREMAKIFTTN